jgi:peptide/nickel transport system substrate-binding protein
MLRRLRWQIAIMVLALAAIAVLLLSQQPIAQTLITQPTAGGLYIEGLVGQLGRLNPLLDYANQADRDVDRLIFSGLVRFDSKGVPQPDLAETIGVNVDGDVYNVTLRSGLLWHDGQPVTSDDVLFTIGLLQDPDMPLSPDLKELWQEVEVTAFDDLTLQFVLPAPFSPFWDYLSFGILPAHLLDGLSPAEIVDHSFNLEPVGTGPYRFEQLLVEIGRVAGVVLNAVEEYYLDCPDVEEQCPFIDQVVFRYFATSADAMAAYRAGEILGIGHITEDILAEAMADPNLNVYTSRLPELSLVLFNLDNSAVSFLQDEAVRRALWQGLNRQRMIDTLLNGQAVLADSPIFPGTWAHFDEIQQITFAREAAISLLKSAGYTIPAEGGNVRVNEEGARLEFEMLYPDDELHRAIAEYIQSDWRQLGVGVELVPLDYETMLAEHLDPRDYEAALIDLNLMASPDPDPYPFWHQAQVTGGQNYSYWDDRRASEYLEQARVNPRIEERTRLYRNFQVHFSRELPAVLLFYPVYSYGVDAQVQGVRIGPLFEPGDRFLNVSEWFLLARGRLEDVNEPASE